MSLEISAFEKRALAGPLSPLHIDATLLEKMPLAMYACDDAGRILWFNSRAATLWGREPRIGDDAEKFCGSHKLYFGGRPVSRDETPMASVLRTGRPVRCADARVERPDGSSIWAMVDIEPVTDGDGNILGAINCFHETTALHHDENDLEDFIENAPIGLHLVSANGTILRANNAELAMLGYSASEYVGHHIREFHADESALNEILGRLRKSEPITQYPARLRAKDGSDRHVLITSGPTQGVIAMPS